MLRKRTDEVSRLSMRFALIHPHGYWKMFKWSDLGLLREYLLIGWKRGMPWRVLSSHELISRSSHEKSLLTNLYRGPLKTTSRAACGQRVGQPWLTATQRRL